LGQSRKNFLNSAHGGANHNGAVAILDGEIVALDKSGSPQFAGLRSKSPEYQIVYFAFDLLTLDGEDLTNNPLIARKAALKRILPKTPTGSVRFTAHIVGAGEDLFQELEMMKLEGMVAKRLDSIYVSGRTRAWLKVKTKAGKTEMKTRSDTWRHSAK
jgi:bifunctional non-homologous end joining protein LigD